MKKILCIEDEPILLNDIMEELVDIGYEVQGAKNGHEGLSMILEFKPDLVISDITMPQMNGYELLVKLREKHKKFADMPFIFLSALSDKKDVMEGLRLGADDFLTKPIDFDVLINRVETRIRQVERMKQVKEEQLVKLYKYYSDLASKTADTAPEPNLTDKEMLAPTTRAIQGISEANKIQVPSEPKFGSTFSFDDNEPLKQMEGTERKSLLGWAQTKIGEFLSDVLTKNDAVVSVPGKGVVVCYDQADRELAVTRSKKLGQDLTTHLRNVSTEEIASYLPYSRSELLNAISIGQSLFEVDLGGVDIKNPNRLRIAIEEKIEFMRNDKSAPRKLYNSLKINKSHLVAMDTFAQSKMIRKLRFSHFDEESQNTINASHALFREDNTSSANYLIEVLSLKLLDEISRNISNNLILVVDVSFTTLLNSTYYLSFFKEYNSVKNSISNGLAINVKNIPPNSDKTLLGEILGPLADVTNLIFVQIEPATVENIAGFGLPISAIVISNPELKKSGIDLSIFSNAKALLQQHQQLLLRDFPSEKEIPEFSGYGFDGFIIRATQNNP